ncbi:MAG: beta-lactamase family protein [Actinomycetota bacterium]|nr:beta-lactamase family protein [Actinomycetota bacterium]
MVGHAPTAERQFRPPLDRDHLSDTLSALARKHQVPGAQLAIHHGGETVAIEVGELEYGSGRRITQDAAFPIGSISKSFTATLAMILVSDGDLELDAPLGEYLPELGDLGDDVTLRQLLSHTAGFANEPNHEVSTTTSIRRYVLDNCSRQNLLLTPGTCFSYSSVGYVLVGHLIEMVTGMNWWDAMESILLRPLRIEPTFICAPGLQSLGRTLAMCHSVNIALDRTRPVEESLPLADAPTSGLAVSAVDLMTLGMTQIDGGMPALLPATYAEEMRQTVPNAEPLGGADGWGLGLAVFGKGTTTWVGHIGVMGGTYCDVRLDPSSGNVVAFTSNANTGRGMWWELVNELRRKGLDLPTRNHSGIEVLGRSTVPPPGCVGSYLNADYEVSIVAANTGSLTLIDGNKRTELIFFDDLSFAAREQPSAVLGRFLRDSTTGKLDLIQIDESVVRRHRPHVETTLEVQALAV